MSYSKEKIKKALELYQQCKSVSQTARILGYPTKENVLKKERKKLLIIINSSVHPRNPPIKIKLNAIKRCFKLGESVKYVAEGLIIKVKNIENITHIKGKFFQKFQI